MNKTILFILLSVFLASNMQAQKRHTADRTRVAKEQAPVAPAKKAEAVSPKRKARCVPQRLLSKEKEKPLWRNRQPRPLLYPQRWLR